VLLALFIGPGGLPAGPFYNLAANLCMLLGVYTANKVFSLLSKPEGKKINYKGETLLVVTATALAMTLRTAIMTVVNYLTLGYPYPFGYSLPPSGIIPILPLIGFFNATLALYTVPLGYTISNVVRRSLGSQVGMRASFTS
jgi:hypothetical protein